MANLKEYLHFYLGKKCLWKEMGRELWLVGIDDYGDNTHPDDKCVRFKTVSTNHSIEMKWPDVETSIRPILRPMSKMTHEEKHSAWQIGAFSVPGEMPEWFKHSEKMKTEANVTKYLLAKGLDVFGLIEMDIAISSEK